MMRTMNNKMKLLMFFLGIVNFHKINGEIFHTSDNKTCETKETCGNWESLNTCEKVYIGGKSTDRKICATEIKCTTTKIRTQPCEDMRFAIDYRKDTTVNVPELSNVRFPATDGISICFWFKVPIYQSGYNAVALYGSPNIPGDNDLLISFVGKTVVAFMRSSKYIIISRKFSLNKWTHLCWVWDSSGNWATYINGTSELSGKATQSKFKGTFPNTRGFLLLGQDKDSGGTVNDPSQMFHGEITQYYLYHEKLSTKEILSAYQNQAPRENLVVGWPEFKGKAKGGNIVETKYPF